MAAAKVFSCQTAHGSAFARLYFSAEEDLLAGRAWSASSESQHMVGVD